MDSQLETSLITMLRVSLSLPTYQSLKPVLSNPNSQSFGCSDLSKKANNLLEGIEEWTLADELIVIGVFSKPALRVEAIEAVIGIYEHYDNILQPRYTQLLHLVEANVLEMNVQDKSFCEKAAQLGLKLLGLMMSDKSQFVCTLPQGADSILWRILTLSMHSASPAVQCAACSAVGQLGKSAVSSMGIEVSCLIVD